MTCQWKAARLALAALVLVGVLAACGDDDDEPAADGSTTTAEALDPAGASTPAKIDEDVELVAPSTTTPESTTESTTIPAPVTDAADDLAAAITADGALPAGDAEGEQEFVVRSTSSGTLSFEGWSVWSDVKQEPNKELLWISTSVDQFGSDQVAGFAAQVREGDIRTPEEALPGAGEGWYTTNCSDHGEVRPYDDGRFAGVSQTHTGCGGATVDTTMVLEPKDGSDYLLEIQAGTLDADDAAAVAHSIATIEVTL